jgi:ABC-type Fe3+-hydroxamate transport system substrate-binding protein
MKRRFTDMLGREVVLDGVPQRIVSLVPSQTELLYDLGLRQEVAGITKFCIHPEEWFRTKARVGGTKQVHIEKVAALKPDLIIANKEENVQDQVEALAEIAPVWVSDITNLEDALRMIILVGELINRPDQAHEIAGVIKHNFETLAQSGGTKKSVAYGIWRNPWMWAGGDTFISDMIRRMGWSNVLDNVPRYPAITLDELQPLRPDIVLLSSEPYPFKEQHMAEVRAVMPEASVLLVDGELFSWYGSRLLHSASYLKSLILRPDE